MESRQIKRGRRKEERTILSSLFLCLFFLWCRKRVLNIYIYWNTENRGCGVTRFVNLSWKVVFRTLERWSFLGRWRSYPLQSIGKTLKTKDFYFLCREVSEFWGSVLSWVEVLWDGFLWKTCKEGCGDWYAGHGSGIEAETLTGFLLKFMNFNLFLRINWCVSFNWWNLCCFGSKKWGFWFCRYNNWSEVPKMLCHWRRCVSVVSRCFGGICFVWVFW